MFPVSFNQNKLLDAYKSIEGIPLPGGRYLWYASGLGLSVAVAVMVASFALAFLFLVLAGVLMALGL